MSVQEAKRVIREDPEGNIARRLEAIEVAEAVLGESCTMKEIWEWVDNDS